MARAPNDSARHTAAAAAVERDGQRRSGTEPCSGDAFLSSGFVSMLNREDQRGKIRACCTRALCVSTSKIVFDDNDEEEDEEDGDEGA